MTPVSTENPAALPADQNQPPSTAGMTTKVVKGSLWTLAGQVAPMAFSLIATPFVIRMLGSEAYGVLILVALIPTYFGFADFGMSLASTKFGSEAYAEGDPEKEARVVRTAALIALLAATPIAILIFAFSYRISALFNVPEHLHAEAALALKFAAVTFVVNFLNGIFNTPQLARLRMDLNTFVTSGFRILGIIATPFVIYLGYGIVGATFVLLFASILTLLGHIYISGRLLPNLKGLSINRESFRPLFKFGSALALSSIAALLLTNAEKGILGYMVSAKALAYYTIAFTIANMMTMFSSAMQQSLVPAFSQLMGDAKQEHLNSLYSRALRMNLILMTPALVLLFILAKPFITIWAGKEFGENSIVPFYILLAGLSFNIVAYLPHAIILTSGRTDILARLYWIELAAYLVIAAWLTWKFGILGTAIAWSLRVIGDAIVHFAIVRKLTVVRFIFPARQSYLIASSVMLLPLLAYVYFDELNPVVTVLTVICCGIYSLITWKLVLEQSETIWVSRMVYGLLRGTR